ncbi:phosphoribosylformylglycinamidine synthase II, partial [Candidatus Bathyarchaeota archaeon]
HEVGLRTIVKPGEADAAVIRITEVPGKAIAVKADCNSRHSYLDPFNGSAGTLAEAARNVACVGAEPLAYTDCCNFGNPEKPEIFWQFKRGIEGLAYMSRMLNIPCVGGNVSFYNEDEESGFAVKPSIVVVMLGLIEKLESITTIGLKNHGDFILILGETYPELGGSEYYHEIYGLTGGKPPKADGLKEAGVLNVVKNAIKMGLVTAAHDCSKGGLAIALALMAINGGLGVKVDLEKIPSKKISSLDELIFSESYGRVILTTDKIENAKEIINLAVKNGISAAIIGKVYDNDNFILQNLDKKIVECSVNALRSIWEESIPKIMEVS